MIVAKDKGGYWHFVEGTKNVRSYYVCITKKGEIVGKLYPEYVPDPVKIWDKKCKLEATTRDNEKGNQLKPNTVVWKLFEHAQEVLNAK